ncbi:MAG: hypothetical protein U0744_03605 [Gemmataceae bacterium]
MKQGEESSALLPQFGPIAVLKERLADAEARRLMEPLDAALSPMRLESAIDEVLRPLGCRAVATSQEIIIARIAKANDLYFGQRVELVCEGERLDAALKRLKQMYRLEYGIADEALGKKTLDVNIRGLSLRDASELFATLAGVRVKWIDRTLVIESAKGASEGASSRRVGVPPVPNQSLVAFQESKPEPKDKSAVPPKDAGTNQNLPSPEGIEAALDEPFAIPAEFAKEFTVKDGFAYLEKRLGVVVMFCKLKRANPEAFPDPKAIHERTLPGWRLGTRMRLRSFVAAIARSLDGADVTFIVREGEIEFLDLSDADPDRIYVQANFEDTPLERVVAQLRLQSGLPIVIDPRLGDARRTKVSAAFPAKTRLSAVVRIIADMADAKVIFTDGSSYITTRANSTAFPVSRSYPIPPCGGVGVSTRPDVGDR